MGKIYKSFNILIIQIVLLYSCYQVPTIQGWDPSRWSAMKENCEMDRIDLAENILMVNKANLLGVTQNNIENLLGNPDRHELYDRNQKFFYYSLDCEKGKELSIRFDALGRVKELQILLLDREMP
jgi:hypothetical protein